VDKIILLRMQKKKKNQINKRKKKEITSEGLDHHLASSWQAVNGPEGQAHSSDL